MASQNQPNCCPNCKRLEKEIVDQQKINRALKERSVVNDIMYQQMVHDLEERLKQYEDENKKFNRGDKNRSMYTV